MKLRLQLFLDALRYSYMTVPMALAVTGLLLAWGTLKLDALSLNIRSEEDPSRAMMALEFGQGLLYAGGVDGAACPAERHRRFDYLGRGFGFFDCHYRFGPGVGTVRFAFAAKLHG